MAGYYNPSYVPSNIYPSNNSYGGAVWQNPPITSQVPVQQSYSAPPMSSNVIAVDGEVGAKAFMVPNGSTGPIALWDTNDSVIYLRTFNAAGMPNPLRKLRYTEEETLSAIPAQSGAGPQIDTSMFVTKQDLDDFKKELKSIINNQNGGKNGNYQGGRDK